MESSLENPSARSNPAELEQRLARVESQLTKLLSEVDARIEKAVGQQPAQSEAHASQSQLAELRQQLMTVKEGLLESRGKCRRWGHWDARHRRGVSCARRGGSDRTQGVWA